MKSSASGLGTPQRPARARRVFAGLLAALACTALGLLAIRETRVASEPGAVLAAPAEPTPAPPTAPPLGAGIAVWESNRSGSYRIWLRGLDGTGLRMLSADEPGRQHCCAKLSPDGARIAYLSREGPVDQYLDNAGALHVVELAGGVDRVVVEGARSYTSGHRAVVWGDPATLHYLDAEGVSRSLSLESGESSPLLPASSEGRRWLVNASLDHATDHPSFPRLLGADGGLAAARLYGGCEPYFSHDGRFGFWVAGAGGPVQALELGTERISVLIAKDDQRLPPDRRYVYFPMLASDASHLAWGASGGEHDHNRADYDVFVAEVDPLTLELRGTPVNLSQDPGSDRYPDVYAVPLALGRFRGEAPLTIELEAPGEGPWRFELGDGTEQSGPRARHRYARAGRYPIRARAPDGRELLGEATVTPSAAPRALGARLVDARRLEVHFDEPVDASAAKATLASGIPIEALAVGADARRLELKLAAPLTSSDTLSLAGIRDRAQQPNRLGATKLAIDAPRWPTERTGLIFLWEDAESPNLVPGDDEQAPEQSFALTPSGRALIDHAGALYPRGGWFQAGQGLGERLASLAKRTHSLSLELSLIAESPGSGSATLVASSHGGSLANFRLAQAEGKLRFQIRTDRWDSGYAADLGPLERDRSIHLVVSYSPGRLRAYRDGELALDTEDVQGDFFHWRDLPLTLGGEWGQAQGFFGRLEGIAIYNRVLGQSEARENARRYAEKRARREPVKAYEAQARLLHRSRTPTLAEIAPYRQALVMFEWQIEGDLPGAALGRRVRVAHWAILDGEIQLVAHAEPGQTARLRLERLDQNPQLESHYLASTLEQPYDGDLYYDVGFVP